MRTFLLLILSAVAYAAPPTIISATAGASPTQIRIEYTASDMGPCKIQASEEADYSPLVPDVDPALFPGSDLDSRAYIDGAWTDPDSPLHRVFVLGTRDIKQASNGDQISTALKYLTLYHGRIGCGASYAETADFTATTAYPTYGRSTRDPFILTPDHFAKWQTVDYNDRSWTSTDPFTGAPMIQFALPQDTRRVTQVPAGFDSCTTTTGWSGCGVLSAGDSTYAGTTQQPLVLRMPATTFFAPYASLPEDYESIYTSWNWIEAHVTGYFSGMDLTTGDRQVELCISFVKPAACDGEWVTAVLPTSSGTIDVGERTVGSLLGAGIRPSVGFAAGNGYREWGSGYLYTSGFSTTIHFTDAADCERLTPPQPLVIPNSTAFNSTINVTAVDCMAMTATVSSAINLDPTGTDAAGWPFEYYAGFEYNPNLALMVRKKSESASNTLHLTGLAFDSGHGGSVGNTSGGFHEFGSQYLDSNGWYKFRANSKLYAYDPVTGQAATLGQVVGAVSGGIVTNSSCATPGYQFFTSANVFYCMGIRPADSKTVLVRVTLTGDTADDVNHPPTGTQNFVGPTSATWEIVSDDIVALTKTFNAAFDDTNYTSCEVFALSGGRYFHWKCSWASVGTQDTLTWQIVYDIVTEEVIAAWNPALGPGWSAWSVFHSGVEVAPLKGENGVNLQSWQGKLGKNEYAGNGRYTFTYAGEYWNGSMFVSGNMPNPCSPCRIKISGTPVSPVAPTTLKEIGEDEVFYFSGSGNTEFLHVVSVQNTDDITIEGPWDPSGVDYPARAWPSGTVGTMMPWWGRQSNLAEGGNIDGTRWAFLEYPNGPPSEEILVSVLPGGGHSVNYDNTIFGAPCLVGIVVPDGTYADRSVFPIVSLENTTFYQPCGLPYFGGTYYAPSYGIVSEAHPSFKPGESWNVMVDSAPIVSPASGSGNAVTHISGSLFKMTYNEIAATDATADGRSLKGHNFILAGHGKIFSDISGPGVMITDDSENAFNQCEPAVDGECHPDSVAGMNEIYFNDPLLVPDKWETASACAPSSNPWGDVCGSDFASRTAVVWANDIPQNTMDAHQNEGFFPVLSQTGMCYRPCKGNTDNGKLLWGNWFFYVFSPQTKGHLITSVLIKIPDEPPPYTADNSTFLTGTVDVSSVPMGTDNVIVRFGYREYAGHCTSRIEICVAHGTIVDPDDPFTWPTEVGGEETIAGVPCAMTCTVAVPVIPGYMAYGTLVYRDAMNEEISTHLLAPFTQAESSSSPRIDGRASFGGNLRLN